MHRDVKPGNILLSDAGHVYLADFGLTRRTEESAALTESRELLGTLDYVAPEQIRNEGVSARADVYSLTCVLFRCLTGELPFAGDSAMAVLWSHLNDPVPSVTERNPDLPSALDPVLAKGMTKEPGTRYARCAELVGDARSALGLRGETAASATGLPRHRRRLIAAVVALLLVIAAGVVAAVLATGGGDEAAPLVVEGNSLVRLNADSGELSRVVPLGARPDAVAVGEGAVWATDLVGGTVTRVSGTGNGSSESVSVPGTPTDIVTGEGFVWVSGFSQGVGKLTRIDPNVLSTRRTVDLEFSDPAALGVGAGSVWVVASNVGRHAVLRVNPETMVVEETISLASTAEALLGIAVTEGAVWVSEQQPGLAGTAGAFRSQLWLINPSTNAVVGSFEVDHGGWVIAAFGAVWLANSSDDRALRFDPSTGAAVRLLDGNQRQFPCAGVQFRRGIAVSGDSAWVSVIDGGVAKIDPTTNESESFFVGECPGGLTATEDAIWVAVASGAG